MHTESASNVDIPSLRESLLRDLRVVMEAAPENCSIGKFIPARTYACMLSLIHALKTHTTSTDLRPVLLELNGLMHIRDNRILFPLEQTGQIPKGHEDKVYSQLALLVRCLCPILPPAESWWHRLGRKMWKLTLWLNGE